MCRALVRRASLLLSSSWSWNRLHRQSVPRVLLSSAALHRFSSTVRQALSANKMNEESKRKSGDKVEHVAGESRSSTLTEMDIQTDAPLATSTSTPADDHDVVHTVDAEAYLACLSVAQRNAVTAPPDEPLQILAGPGSGKTRVLVSRVAWLILKHNINPRDLVVVTFTNKAANEMRVRLNKLIGPMRTSFLIMGTFHATCAKYLRRHAQLVGIGNNFSICDSDESKKVIKAILKENESLLQSNDGSNLRPELCIAEISRAKAKNLDPDSYLASLDEKQATQSATGRRTESTAIRRVVAKVYKMYADHLARHNALDFDDLLVYGVRLFATHARVIANVRHVLVDEFQDTNTIQYELMACLAGRAGSRGAVSIVGDPDQSIYGWRSAEVGNLDKMVDEFGGWAKDRKVRRVFLEENYRSTAHILQAAKAIIENSSSRIDRGLYTSHAKGPAVVLKRLESSRSEANFIATEIKRIIAHAGGMLNYDDFAILLRYNALSRSVEQQLMSESIPSRIMGGARFFERKEVKDLLAYLILADNPGFTPALSRVINVPKRSIGEKSVKDLHQLAEKEGVHTMTIVERVVEAPGTILGIKPSVQKSLRSFLDVIREIRAMEEKNDSVANIINKVMERIGYEAYLKKEPDFEQRWENVKELINFSTVIALDVERYADLQQSGEDGSEADVGSPSLLSQLRQSSSSQAPSRMTSSQALPRASPSSQAHNGGAEVIELLTTDEEDSEVEKSASPTVNKQRIGKAVKAEGKEEYQSSIKAERGAKEDNGITIDDLPDEDKSPLRVFLEACTLSTDMEEKHDDNTAKQPKVTIATAHAAKGLEFPVVFVLAVEEQTYPFYRSSGSVEEIDEETRLLYVAITRAQAMAYMTHCSFRYVNGEEQPKTLSRFVSRIAEFGKVSGGEWRPQAATTDGVQPGGFTVRTLGYKPIKPAPKKVDFGLSRPSIGPGERRVFARVLGRPLPKDSEADKLRAAFDASDVNTRIKRLDGDSAQISSSVGGRGMNSLNWSSMSLFAMKDESPTFYTPTIQTATSLMKGGGRGISSSSINGTSSSSGMNNGRGHSYPATFGSSATFGNASGQRFNSASAASLSAASLAGGGRYPPASSYVSGAPHPQSALARLSNVSRASKSSAPAAKRLGMGRAPLAFPSKKAKHD